MPQPTAKSQRERKVKCRYCYRDMQNLRPPTKKLKQQLDWQLGWHWYCEKCGHTWRSDEAH